MAFFIRIEIISIRNYEFGKVSAGAFYPAMAALIGGAFSVVTQCCQPTDQDEKVKSIFKKAFLTYLIGHFELQLPLGPESNWLRNYLADSRKPLEVQRVHEEMSDSATVRKREEEFRKKLKKKLNALWEKGADTSQELQQKHTRAFQEHMTSRARLTPTIYDFQDVPKSGEFWEKFLEKVNADSNQIRYFKLPCGSEEVQKIGDMLTGQFPDFSPDLPETLLYARPNQWEIENAPIQLDMEVKCHQTFYQLKAFSYCYEDKEQIRWASCFSYKNKWFSWFEDKINPIVFPFVVAKRHVGGPNSLRPLWEHIDACVYQRKEDK